jgi:hypothetical protein
MDKTHETSKGSSKLDNFAIYEQDEELNQKTKPPKNAKPSHPFLQIFTTI